MSACYTFLIDTSTGDMDISKKELQKCSNPYSLFLVM